MLNRTILIVCLLLLLSFPVHAALVKKGEAVASAELACEADGTCEAAEDLPPCEDKNDSCREWADDGECISNPLYMNTHCALSCGHCLPEK